MIRTNLKLVAYTENLFNSGEYDIWKEEFGPKQKIIEQDHRYNKIYLIKSGIAKCYISDENGKEFIQEFLGEGMEFGELEFFNKGYTICSVESITALKVFVFSYASFNQLLDSDRQFNQLIMKALADKIRYKAPRHSYQHSYPIEDNLIRLKELFPEFTEIISKKDIANYIGVTPRSLNRALKELKEKSDQF
ncbi:Crp/Fnr family transcriptional regulator [Flagellimonas pacifica]|uniref:cAMP-binding domain of CRP or a regulatory subunit of cAMP-dependent protein kinases n=1 Tax=Flagellimonas pacifica TaxID=1247520 RepID=A0A285MS43_9FLAO|nr:Crp/Fnr family transcriptional regulator [Allomuricauda parva]SNY99985.1 cAMP-binding domain of CRP or a regulatory subunit of cAMP-dependent protein kinases [Allomuricauda parva]